MKKLALLIILIPIISVSQVKKKKSTSKPTIKKEWLEAKDIIVVKNSKYVNASIYLEDADKNLNSTNIMIACDTALYRISKMDEVKLNRIIKRANIETMFAVKNRYTYKPKEILVTYDRTKDKWRTDVTYVAQNDYGALKNGLYSCMFSNDGEFLYSL